MKKKNYAAIDVAKYVSALLVVCIHTYPLYDLSPAANTFLIQAICRFAVPFFFVVSGFLFFSKIDPAAGMCDALNLGMLKHYLRRLALLYGAWSVIYLPYTFLLWRGDGFSLTFLLRWIFDCFFNGSYYHLWFLPALMLGTLIVYVLYTNVSLRRGMLVTAILYAIGMGMNVYGSVLAQIPFVASLYQLYMSVFTTARNGIFFAPVFLYVGIYLKAYPNVYDKKEYALGIASFYGALLLEEGLAYACGVLQDLTSMYLMLVPFTYFLVGALLQVQRTPSYLCRFLRQSSLLIYVSHILFAMPLLALFPDHHLLVYGAVIVCAQLLAVVIIALSNRFSWLKVLC